MVIVGLIYVTASILIHLLRSQYAIMTLVLDLSITFKSWYVSLVVDACQWNTYSMYIEGPPIIQFRVNHDNISCLGSSTVVCVINRLPLRVSMSSFIPSPQGYSPRLCMAYPVYHLVLLSLYSKCSRSRVLSLDEL